MTSALDDLVGILGEQAQHLRRLLPLLERQERALLAADARAVLELTESQAFVTAELRVLEGKRRALAARLTAELGLPRETLTISALLAQIPSAPSELTRVRAELRDVGARVVTLTRRNAFVLERSIGYVSDLLRAVVDAAAPLPTYAASGLAERGTAALGVVDRQA